MYELKRTDSNDLDFQNLVRELDQDLAIRDGEDHSFYHQFNGISALNHVVVLYENGQAVGCGALKEFEETTMEIKRMFVPIEKRGKGLASRMLNELETWTKELGYTKCILETGLKQPEAIRFYIKNDFVKIENYGQYAGVENSVCFEKEVG